MQRPFIILLQAWLTGVDFKKATSCLKVAPLVEKWEMQHWVSAFCSWCNFNPLHCIDKVEGQRSPERSHYSSCVKWSRPLQNCLSFCLTLSHHLLSLSPFGLVLSLSLNPQSHLTSSHQQRSTGARTHPQRLPMRRFLKEDHDKVMVEVKPNQRGQSIPAPV